MLQYSIGHCHPDVWGSITYREEVVCQAGSWICNHSPSTQAVSEESHKVPNRNWEAQHDSPPPGSRLPPFDQVLGSSSLFVSHMTWQSMLRTVKGFLFFFSFKIFKTKQSKSKQNLLMCYFCRDFTKSNGKMRPYFPEMWKGLPWWLWSRKRAGDE